MDGLVQLQPGTARGLASTGVKMTSRYFQINVLRTASGRLPANDIKQLRPGYDQFAANYWMGGGVLMDNGVRRIRKKTMQRTSEDVGYNFTASRWQY